MSENNSAKTNKFLLYKEKPLVRSGDVIYYGNPAEKCVVMLQILDRKTENGQDLPSKVQVSLLSTDESLKPKDRVLKKSEKDSLYTALDIGVVWLERALEQ